MGNQCHHDTVPLISLYYTDRTDWNYTDCTDWNCTFLNNHTQYICSLRFFFNNTYYIKLNSLTIFTNCQLIKLIGIVLIELIGIVLNVEIGNVHLFTSVTQIRFTKTLCLAVFTSELQTDYTDLLIELIAND